MSKKIKHKLKHKPKANPSHGKDKKEKRKTLQLNSKSRTHSKTHLNHLNSINNSRVNLNPKKLFLLGVFVLLFGVVFLTIFSKSAPPGSCQSRDIIQECNICPTDYCECVPLDPYNNYACTQQGFDVYITYACGNYYGQNPFTEPHPYRVLGIKDNDLGTGGCGPSQYFWVYFTNSTYANNCYYDNTTWVIDCCLPDETWDPNQGCVPQGGAVNYYYCDVDGDTHYSSTITCTDNDPICPPSGVESCQINQPGDDCDDNRYNVHPGWHENQAYHGCTDGLDNDCDNDIDAQDEDCSGSGGNSPLTGFWANATTGEQINQASLGQDVRIAIHLIT